MKFLVRKDELIKDEALKFLVRSRKENLSRSLYDYEVIFRSRIVFFQNNGTKMIRRNWEKEKGRWLEEKSVLEASHVGCQGTFLLAANNVRNKKSRKIKQDPPRLLSQQSAYHTLIQTRLNVGAYIFNKWL